MLRVSASPLPNVDVTCERSARQTLGLCLTAIVFLNGFSAVAPTYPLYVALKFCVGFFQGGFIIAMFVLCNELIGASKRGHVSNGLQCAFALGIVLYSFSAYYCRHWRSLTLLVTLGKINI